MAITRVYSHVPAQVCFVATTEGTDVTRVWLEFQVYTHLVPLHISLLIALEGTASFVAGHHSQASLVNSLDVMPQAVRPCSHEVTAVVSAEQSLLLMDCLHVFLYVGVNVGAIAASAMTTGVLGRRVC